MQNSSVIVVEFKTPNPPSGIRCWYFSSIAAIYGQLDEAVLGISKKRLWSLGIARGLVYDNRLVRVSKQPLHRLAQKKPHKSRTLASNLAGGLSPRKVFEANTR